MTDLAAVAECYSRMTNPFGALGPFYDALGHRGADYRRSRSQPVVAYESGVVVRIDYSGGIGHIVTVELDGGGWAAWAHLRAIQVRVGWRVYPGDTLAYVASYGDDPGSLWDGDHIHTTLSFVSAYNAAFGVRPLADPVPRITTARTAALNVTPIAPSPKENSMTTLYGANSTNDRSKPMDIFALAGDGAGPAGWLEISDPQLANELAGAHHISGRFVFLSTGTWAAWKAAYLGKQPVDASISVPEIKVPPVELSVDAKSVVDEYFRQLSERARD